MTKKIRNKFVLIKVTQNMEDRVRRELADMTELDDIHRLFGSYQYIIEVPYNGYTNVTYKLGRMKGIIKCKWLNGC